MVLFANPSSIHEAGLQVAQALDQAVARVRTILGAGSNDHVLFTSGGTESINLAIQGVVLASTRKRKHIITTSLEHKAVLETCAFLSEKYGVRVTYIAPRANGIVRVRDIVNTITPDTILISVMYANNEIGTIQPLREIGAVARRKGIIFHTDACQAGCYADLDVSRLGVDLMTLNSGKMYGPKGAGLLYVRKGVSLVPLMYGGSQQSGLRPGTENVAGIMGFVKALELAQKERVREVKRLITLRDGFIEKILKAIPDSRLNGDAVCRLANNINLSFRGVEGEALVRYLSQQKIYVSTASACSAHSIEVSHVIKEIGVPTSYARGTIRLTLGKETTRKEMEMVGKKVGEIVNVLRRV